MQNAQRNCKSHDAVAVENGGIQNSAPVAERIGPSSGSILDRVDHGTMSASWSAKHLHETRTERTVMLNWTITFLIVALIAAALGFGGIAGTAASIAKILFVVFLVLFLVSLITGRRRV